MNLFQRRDKTTPLLPKLRIAQSVWQKMMAYIINCPVEVNGFGMVSYCNGVIEVHDVFILDQVATAAGVETDPEALNRLVYEMTRSGDNPGAIKFQWHSHVEMQAYFSSTDTANINNWPGDWLVSVVANKHGEYSCRFDIFRPVRLGLELQPRIYTPMPRELSQAAAREVAQHVKSPGGMFRRRLRPHIDGETPSADPIHYDPEDIEFVGPQT